MKVSSLVIVASGLCILGVAWFLRTESPALTAAPQEQTEKKEGDTGSPSEEPRRLVHRIAVDPAQPRVLDQDANVQKDSDLPTPTQPGSGQALLQVEVVTQETGWRLAGARLWMSSTFNDEEREWISSTQPDPSRGVENDEVQTDGTGRGEFLLQAGFSYTLHGSGSDGMAEEGELTLKPLYEGEVRRVRLALSSSWELEWHGRVLDGEREMPLPGVEVSVVVKGSAERAEDLHELAHARSDGDGRVVLPLPAWERMLALGRAPEFFLGGCPIDDGARTPETAQVLILQRAANLNVRVTEADGSPASQVHVALTTGSWAIGAQVTDLERFTWSGETDTSGSCLFAGLPSAADLLVSLRPMHRLAQVPRDTPVRLAPGERAVRQWGLRAGGTIEARVRARTGDPLRGVEVVLRSLQYESDAVAERWREFVTRLDSFGSSLTNAEEVAVSDAEGFVHFEGAPPGWWILGPRAASVPDIAILVRVPTELTPIEVEIVVDVGLRISGTVLTPGGQPAKGARVSWRGAERRLLLLGGQEFADHDGVFVLPPLVEGAYQLEAVPEDPFQQASPPIEARTGGGPVEIHLRPAGVARGVVVDTEGKPVEAGVSFLTERGWVGGDFDVGNLAPGLHNFVARTDDGRIGILRGVQIVEGYVHEGLAITVDWGGRLTVRTRNETDSAHAVEVFWEGVELRGGQGKSITLTVPPGEVIVRWVLWKEGESRRLAHEELRTVEAGQELTLELELR